MKTQVQQFKAPPSKAPPQISVAKASPSSVTSIPAATSASGSHFQTNSLDGTDQGMSSITLRGLDHSSTLVLINNKRQTAAGTTSNDGEGYIDINIIPQIALREVQILKEGASSAYGSDAIAGVVNFLTYKNFKGSRFKFSNQQTTKCCFPCIWHTVYNVSTTVYAVLAFSFLFQTTTWTTKFNVRFTILFNVRFGQLFNVLTKFVLYS